MEEELHLLRELYASAARKNLAEENFYNFMTAQHGGMPAIVPAGMADLSRLSNMNYNPNLEDVNNVNNVNENININDEQRQFGYWVFFLFVIPFRTQNYFLGFRSGTNLSGHSGSGS